jgi:hypothetical protein
MHQQSLSFFGRPVAPRLDRHIQGGLGLAAALLLCVGFSGCAKKADVEGNGGVKSAATMAEDDEKREAAVDAGLAVPDGARVFFVSPADGVVIEGPVGVEKVKVHLVFGVEGMTVKPAGEIIAGTGHHHIIIDAAGTDFGQPVPKNDTHIHYGGGQTEADVELAAGTYTLTLQFANGAHLSYGDKLRSSLRVIVKAADPIPAGGGVDAVAPLGEAPAAGDAPAAGAAALVPAGDPAAAADQ